MRIHYIYITLCLLLVSVIGCKQKDTAAPDAVESQEAKSLLQGIWVDEETENVVFKVRGDTIFYPDSTSLPAYFKIVADTMLIGSTATKYPLVKQTAHLFWFKNQNGDVIKLTKSEEASDSLNFSDKHPDVLTITEVTKRDTVVNYKDQRYHCYVTINPTKNKVESSSYSDDAVEVSNVYYDNIAHLSVFQGNVRLFGKNFQKTDFVRFVPESFLSQAILSNAEYDHVDEDGFHFNVTLCTPNTASCYLMEVVISFKGKYNLNLLGN